MSFAGVDAMIVKRAERSDLPQIAMINAQAFAGNGGDLRTALRWVECWFRAFPLYQYFIVVVEGRIVGYIGWQIHGGFLRSDPVMELEQVAFLQEYQGKGLGPKLIAESLEMMKAWVCSEGSRDAQDVNLIVWAYDDNRNALTAYEKTLFTDGTRGMRLQYVNRGAELMLRGRIPLNQVS